MPLLSDSISRRYTPPTCTLEINAQTSALSRWTRQPVVKQLQFQLSFDNLLGSDDQPVQISGDRAQLDSLCEVVESYVQKLLNQFPTSWHDQLLKSTVAADPSDTFEPVVSVSPWPQATGGAGQAAGVPMTELPETQGIYLQQKNSLFHNLFPGSLATETSGVISLSTSQLFDLASALEEYAAEAIALPVKQRPAVAWVQGTPIWARTAAIAVVAVGITTVALQLTNNSNPISQRTNEQPSPPPPAVPPPPPPGSTPLPSAMPTVPIPSSLPSIEPPPVTSISPGAAPKPSQSDNPQVAINPSPVPAPKNGIVVEPRSNPSDQTTISKADPESEIFSANEDSASRTASAPTAPTAQSKQPSETAFDTIPQVAEIRSYFQQRWQPPKGLKQTLQYTLILNSDGSIRGSLPRSQAAETYLDRTPIPLANEPFVSSVEDGGNPKIRVVLDPNGDVETFLESSK